MGHIKGFDSIRAVAVFLVILSHWIPKLNVYPIGGIGVDMFFVLSGFLISGILLDNRTQVEVGGANQISIVGIFIIRRTLRIFPIYYLMVLVHFLVADMTGTKVKQYVVYYLTYTTNVLYVNKGSVDGIASHFWSLAVEEQFYLFWPWIILLLSRKYLPYVFFLFFILGTIFPMIVPGTDKLTPSCFNAFAVGGILAYADKEGFRFTASLNRIVRYLALVSISCLLIYPLLHVNQDVYSPVRLLMCFPMVWLIRYCLYYNDNRVLNFVLNCKVLIFVGKISYGVYIYHTIIPWAWKLTMKALVGHGLDFHSLYFFLPEFLFNDMDLIVKLGIVLIVSWLSWIMIEKPITSLKNNFSYPEPK